MANYTTADIKEIREKTGAGMLDVKKALDEAEGDKGKAVELLRVKGLKGITKREGRSASNGLVAAKVEGNVGTLVEVNTETDFVAKGEKFIAMADQILQAAAASGAADVESLMEVDVDGQPVKKLIEDNAAAIGEKMEVRRVARIEGEHVVSYLHKTNPDLPPQVGVLFAFSGGDEQIGRDVAMHIAAFSPSVLTEDEIDEETVANERRIAEETAREEGKPEQALPKIIEGRVKGYFAENVLLDQKYAKDQKKTVAKVLEEAGATAIGFARFRVGS
ncbi:translation elongation factor Ts [Dermatophilus congolensis]|uniref:translation elongation factor Ts n=1 Tax=Dermatophilus congolensis TaxID=1863 RepID=UPI001AAE836C|nr:translation elongation factor Ts [Dermatophilus congolensis]MBO3142272.1 elongation factor Ts [Dermatophilus congolensis]MBO3151263.1 elongation factor Ts [Dermatophilus congolensis]MBO3161733.1 elongation factor Ts [Dermatophilus congolensis]MBO3162549.1 elongation factor Ts [Dermatophilus congolensis]MBO3176102.1 elongation factor Ts [Dermatophilus congolensis]